MIYIISCAIPVLATDNVFIDLWEIWSNPYNEGICELTRLISGEWWPILFVTLVWAVTYLTSHFLWLHSSWLAKIVWSYSSVKNFPFVVKWIMNTNRNRFWNETPCIHFVRCCAYVWSKRGSAEWQKHDDNLHECNHGKCWQENRGATKAWSKRGHARKCHDGDGAWAVAERTCDQKGS